MMPWSIMTMHINIFPLNMSAIPTTSGIVNCSVKEICISSCTLVFCCQKTGKPPFSHFVIICLVSVSFNLFNHSSHLSCKSKKQCVSLESCDLQFSNGHDLIGNYFSWIIGHMVAYLSDVQHSGIYFESYLGWWFWLIESLEGLNPFNIFHHNDHFWWFHPLQ